MYKILEKFTLRSDSVLETQTIPLYDLKAVAGINALFVGDETPVDQIEVMDLPKCDGMLPVVGDSMEPILHEGDFVLYKTVPNRSGGLFWGNMYMIAFVMDGEEYISIKYLQHSDQPGYYRLVSENPKHKPKEIPVSSVRAMAIVKASMTIHHEEK